MPDWQENIEPSWGFKLTPNNLLTANEIDAANEAYPAIGLRRFNPQQQIPLTWPSEPEVALAYLDQLNRDNILEGKTIDNITKILDRVDSAMKRGGNNRLSRQIERIELNMDDPKFNGTTKYRIQKLNSTLQDIAQKLKR